MNMEEVWQGLVMQYIHLKGGNSHKVNQKPVRFFARGRVSILYFRTACIATGNVSF